MRNFSNSKCHEKPLRIGAAETYCTSITLRAAAKSWSLLYESKCQTGGKPSTWFPPGGLVEQSTDEKQNNEDEDEDEDEDEENDEDEDGDEDDERRRRR